MENISVFSGLKAISIITPFCSCLNINFHKHVLSAFAQGVMVPTYSVEYTTSAAIYFHLESSCARFWVAVVDPPGEGAWHYIRNLHKNQIKT